jgi:hypothetical protein
MPSPDEVSLMPILAFVALCSALATSAAADRVDLDKTDRFRLCEPNFEAARVLLASRGETYSPGYIQGLSGQAFRIGGPCPCAPTCNGWMGPEKLLALLGYEVQTGDLSGEGEARAQSWEPIRARIKAELRAGRPVMVWSAFTYYEWDLVCGFDDETGQFMGRGSYPDLQEHAVARQDRPMEFADVTNTMAIFLGGKTGTLDARAAELDALQEAVDHAHKVAGKGLRLGLDCYDNWLGYLDDPAESISGNLYCLNILVDTRRAAADFLREIAPRYPAASPYLELAAEHYTQESLALLRAVGALGDKRDESLKDPVIRARVRSYVAEARAMYAQAADELAHALRKTNTKAPNP